MENISPVYARFVLREVLQQGHSAEALLEGIPLDREQLQTGGDIAMEHFLHILRRGRQLTGNEQLGLMIGSHASIITLGPVGAAAAIAPSVREGLQVIENYTRLHISYLGMELASSVHGLSVRFRFLQVADEEIQRFHLESAVMLIQHYVERSTGQALDDAQYRLSIAAPDYVADYAQWLHSPVSFDWPQSSAELPGYVLDLPSPYFNADMWQQTTLDLARRIQALEGEESHPYTQYVDTLMRSCTPPLPDLPEVATRLHMSERTLNRRLQQEGSGFRQIRGKLLHSWARQHLLETDYSVEAIAAILGYQDAANFRRAFRKSEGCSPGEFRRSAGGS